VTPPPFDPELALTLDAIRERLPPTVTPEMVQPMRDAPPPVGIDEVLAGRPITRTDHTVPGHEGGEIEATVFARVGHTVAGPGILRFHGGGMVMGSRFAGIGQSLDWVERFDAVCVSVDYRLAPEHPDPYPVEDCYATLVWAVEHAADLGIDTGRVVVTGPSAGGGLAAGVALLARDRGGPALLGQLLVSPMLDDRNDTVSAHQIDGVGVWDRGSNEMGWNALLGDRRKTDAVSIYAAPARATDLARLPSAFVECGSAEVFRDEDVAYASGLWAAGSQAELHVWPGGFHASDQLAPNARLSRDTTAARDAWMARLLGL
jgi:acetyl esterase/lipase